MEREIRRDMDVRGVQRKPVLVKRIDNLIVFDLPRTGFYSVGVRAFHNVAAGVVVDDDGVGKFANGDIFPGQRRLAGQETRREGPIEARSGRHGAVEHLGVVLVGKELERDVRRVPVDKNRLRRPRRILRMHGRRDIAQAKHRQDSENREQDEAHRVPTFNLHSRTHRRKERNLCRLPRHTRGNLHVNGDITPPPGAFAT